MNYELILIQNYILHIQYYCAHTYVCNSIHNLYVSISCVQPIIIQMHCMPYI